MMPQHEMTHVFTGPEALKNYLDPCNGSYTPLVEMPSDLNPYSHQGIKIYAKMLNALPLANVKSIPAFHMLQQAGDTRKTKIIESSSGNTVASLGLLGAYFGYQETHALVSHEVTTGKLDLLRLFGVHPIVNKEPICPSESDETSGIKKARKMGKKKNWFNPDQYSNPSNGDAHYQVTGPQIWEQTNGKADFLCASMGTTGTILGTSRFLKEKNPHLQTIGIIRSPNNPVPGPRTRTLLDEVAFDWEGMCDELVEVGTREAYGMSLSMIRKGLLVGPSSGMALAGLLKFIENRQDLFTGKDEKTFTFICCDSALPYVNEYFRILPEDNFPSVVNQHLLLDNGMMHKKPDNTDISVDAMALNGMLQSKERDMILIDLRHNERFSEYHIPDSVNIPEGDFISNIGVFSALYQNKQAVLVCEQGVISGLLAPYARNKGFDVMSLDGGLLDWSDKNLPRVKHTACTL